MSIFDYSNFQVFDATNFALLILDFKVQVLWNAEKCQVELWKLIKCFFFMMEGLETAAIFKSIATVAYTVTRSAWIGKNGKNVISRPNSKSQKFITVPKNTIRHLTTQIKREIFRNMPFQTIWLNKLVVLKSLPLPYMSLLSDPEMSNTRVVFRKPLDDARCSGVLPSTSGALKREL